MVLMKSQQNSKPGGKNKFGSLQMSSIDVFKFGVIRAC